MKFKTYSAKLHKYHDTMPSNNMKYGIKVAHFCKRIHKFCAGRPECPTFAISDPYLYDNEYWKLSMVDPTEFIRNLA